MGFQLARYVYYTAILATAGISSWIVDDKPVLSRILRVLVYASPWILIPFSVIALDQLSAVFLALTTLGSIAISLYSEGYLKTLFGRIGSLQVIVDTSLILLTVFFTTQSFFEFVIAWILVEFSGTLLIMLEKGFRNFSIVAKYLIVCVTAGDISLFLLLALVILKVGFEKALIVELAELSILEIKLDPILTILALIGFTTKLAQIPLHFWLPDTYSETPSPGTAILSGLMSKMAVYAILKLFSSVGFDTSTYTWMLVVQGLITAVYGFFTAAINRDLKRIMSYSSMGYYGVMCFALGLIPLNPLFTSIALILAIYHGLTKTLVFLNIASIEILANTRNVYELGYLAQVARDLYNNAVVAFLSLAGAPPTLGFLAKFTLIAVLLESIETIPHIALPALVCLSLAFILAIVYSVKYISTYTSLYKSKPVRPPIELQKTQIVSESVIAALILASPLAVIILTGVKTLLDIVALATYLAGMFIFALPLVERKWFERREIEPWIGGVEV